MAHVTGVAIEKKTGNPVQYASVRLRNQSFVIASTVANRYGRFNFETSSNYDNILISSVGYKTKAFAKTTVNDAMYFLEKDIKELEPVVLTPAPREKKNTTWAWALLGLAIIAKQNT